SASSASHKAPIRAARSVGPLPWWTLSDRPAGRTACQTGRPSRSSPVTSARRVTPCARDARIRRPRKAAGAAGRPRSRGPGMSRPPRPAGMATFPWCDALFVDRVDVREALPVFGFDIGEAFGLVQAAIVGHLLVRLRRIRLERILLAGHVH